jgi:hypothetical protein
MRSEAGISIEGQKSRRFEYLDILQILINLVFHIHSICANKPLNILREEMGVTGWKKCGS